MLIAIIFSLVLGLAFAFFFRMIANGWVENKYNSPEWKQARHDEYMEDLQTYVSEKQLSSSDTVKITQWLHQNRNVYLFLFKDKQLLFDSSINQDKDEDADGKNPGDATDNGGSSSDNTTGSNTPGADGNEGDGAPSENENGSTGTGSDKNKGDETTRPGGGITIDYPTRDEILATAEKNGYHTLEMSDGTLLVTLADFTDYIYYDVFNIASIVGGVLIIVIFLMLYFQRIIFKISRLAKDVSLVYEVDMNKPIRCEKGSDEISRLGRNVEQMRSSMIVSLQKEKEAIEANSELITSMSHDIRTPLTVLLGYLDIMKNSTDDTAMQEYIKASETTALRLKDLSDDMFRYFLVFGGHDNEISISDYEARTLIEQLFTEHILLMNESGYTITLNIAQNVKETARVSTDAPKLMRVIDNLFSNIRKYADPLRPVTVDAALSYGKLVCTVKNYVIENTDGKESNRIGLKTCEKICESLGMGFEYYTSGGRSQRTFTVKIEFPMARGTVEDNSNA